jgi:hypothetical protein
VESEREGGRDPIANALARLGHRGPAGRRRRRPLTAGAAVRARRRACPRVAAGPAAGQGRHGSGNRYLDNLYEPFGLCVELDGNAAHPAEGRWRDTRRDNANLAQGARTLRYGWPDVTEYRCRTAAEIAEVLRSQGWTGTLRRCGPGCTAVGPQERGERQEQDERQEQGG